MQKRILLLCTLIVAALTNVNEKPLGHRHMVLTHSKFLSIKISLMSNKIMNYKETRYASFSFLHGYDCYCNIDGLFSAEY